MNTYLQTEKLESLKNRVLLTFILLTLVRIGNFIPLPFIDRETFETLLKTDSSTTNALAKIIKTFSGGGNTSFGLLSLGILPYINASIIFQLLTKIIPSLSKMQKEEGEYGRRKLTDYVRSLTFFWAVVQSIFLTYNLRELIFDWNFWTGLQISLTLITGSMIVLWFSELITRKGLGNGSSLLICFNIVSSLPDELKILLENLKNKTNGINDGILIFAIFFLTTIGCIYINEAIITIPLVSARQLLRKPTIKSQLGKTVLPLRINQAGVMPLVFTSYSMVLFSFLLNFLKNQSIVVWFLNNFSFFNQPIWTFCIKIVFWAIYASLIFFFTSFYSNIILNPKDVADRFRKESVIIVGISPGKPTKSYLNRTLKKIAKINAIFLITNILGLQILEYIFNINLPNLRGLGFTSQLILVNVIIETLRRIPSFLNDSEIENS